VGDDCAAFAVPPGALALVSTDRVPADLIAFRTGVLDYRGLGRYLSVLNLSDVAACGGVPIGLLLNLGLPPSLDVADLMSLCEGAHEECRLVGAKILGGDMSVADEISLSATPVGHVEQPGMLRRYGARPGDSIFLSRPVGLTPVALQYCLRRDLFGAFSAADIEGPIQQ
jgi:thiamine-monophosphate kinase